MCLMWHSSRFRQFNQNQKKGKSLTSLEFNNRGSFLPHKKRMLDTIRTAIRVGRLYNFDIFHFIDFQKCKRIFLHTRHLLFLLHYWLVMQLSCLDTCGLINCALTTSFWFLGVTNFIDCLSRYIFRSKCSFHNIIDKKLENKVTDDQWYDNIFFS